MLAEGIILSGLWKNCRKHANTRNTHNRYTYKLVSFFFSCSSTMASCAQKHLLLCVRETQVKMSDLYHSVQNKCWRYMNTEMEADVHTTESLDIKLLCLWPWCCWRWRLPCSLQPLGFLSGNPKHRKPSNKTWNSHQRHWPDSGGNSWPFCNRIIKYVDEKY